MKKNILTKYIVIALLLLTGALVYWGCSEDANPLPSTSHVEAWSDTESEDFHGQKVSSAGYESCKSCHGSDFSGGKSHVSCYDCHSNFPHPREWMAISNEQFHGNYIRLDGWSMDNCKNCHGGDYKGGTTGASCYNCHKQGPDACNVCHGGGSQNHPPEDLTKNIETSALGVGAHAEHMGLTFINCETCHKVPATFDDPDHIDLPPAEIKAQWGWDRNTGACANACHGAALIWNNF